MNSTSRSFSCGGGPEWQMSWTQTGQAMYGTGEPPAPEWMVTFRREGQSVGPVFVRELPAELDVEHLCRLLRERLEEDARP